MIDLESIAEKKGSFQQTFEILNMASVNETVLFHFRDKVIVGNKKVDNIYEIIFITRDIFDRVRDFYIECLTRIAEEENYNDIRRGKISLEYHKGEMTFATNKDYISLFVDGDTEIKTPISDFEKQIDVIR